MPHQHSTVRQVVHTRPASDLGAYQNIREAILQTLNLSLESYRRHLREIRVWPALPPLLIGQMILRWLHPEIQTKEQIIEAIMVENFTALLPFKLKNWVLCNKSTILEEAISFLDA